MTRDPVILGLGTNLEDRAARLQEAVIALATILRLDRVSSVYESPALLDPGAPQEWNLPYLNLAVAGVTGQAPHELLKGVKAIEKRLGRQARGHWAPREIDIDILAYGVQVVEEMDLIIPHRELLNRDFALVPLAEIAPNWMYPHKLQQDRTAQSLCRELFPESARQLRKTGISISLPV